MARVGGLRSSELLALRWGDVEKTKVGRQFKVRKSKTDQTGNGRTFSSLHVDDVRFDVGYQLDSWQAAWEQVVGRRPKDHEPIAIPADPNQLLWIQEVFEEDNEGDSSIKEDRRQGTERETREHEKPFGLQALSYGSFNLMVKKRASQAGYENLSDFSTHSLRVGHAPQAFEDGASIFQTAFSLGHKDPRSTRGYSQHGYDQTAEGSVEQRGQQRINNQIKHDLVEHKPEHAEEPF